MTSTVFTTADVDALNALDDDNRTLIRGLLNSRRRRDMSADTDGVIDLSNSSDDDPVIEAQMRAAALTAKAKILEERVDANEREDARKMAKTFEAENA